MKAWLDCMQKTPLYKFYKITVDWEKLETDHDGHEQEEIEEVDSNNDCELIVSTQQSLLWSEEKYLNIAPGEKSTPLSII